MTFKTLTFGVDGALWVGAYLDGGLTRLDEEGLWQNYKRDPNKTLSRIHVLALGTNGTLWIGAFFEGLARLDKDGRWQNYSRASTNDGLPNDSIAALAPGADGSVYGRDVQRLGAARQGRALAELQQGPAPTGASQTIAFTRWRWARMASFGSGHTKAGLARLDKGGRWQTYSKASTNDGLPDDGINALAPGADGSVWVGTSPTA